MRLDQIRLAVMARRENRFEGIARNIICIIRIIRIMCKIWFAVSMEIAKRIFKITLQIFSEYSIVNDRTFSPNVV